MPDTLAKMAPFADGHADMNCYVETQGCGPDVVLLHGWGLHGGVFERVAAALSAHYCVHTVDLPGHGASPELERFDAAEVAAALARQFPLPVHVLGWSLGGLVAQHWAVQQAAQIRSLALVSTSPRFVQGPDWAFGQRAAAIEEVGANLHNAFELTLKNFLALQMLGAPHARDTLKALSGQLFAHGRPHGLLPALDCLLQADTRALAAQIHAPTALFFGARDRITPTGAGRWLADMLPDARLHLFEQASHAPFLSHEHDFLTLLLSHLDRHA
ncbi:pimeloyl-ACP methyl ester esterase BioH [Craterilacuibacter sinensis]|nr:pimeloyl-ACP methyl ester esterase BioH [Craterilacuibacter sinensis]